MKEEFTREHWKDFAQRYQGVFGWFETEKKEQLLVRLTKVDENTLTFSDRNKIVYSARADKGNVFTFLPVEKGVYNSKNGDVLFVFRIPMKQYRRGVCPDNTGIRSLISNDAINVDFDTLDAIYNTDQTKPVLQWCKTRKGNIAFNNLFSLANDRLYLYQNLH